MKIFKNTILYLRLWFNLTHQTSRKLDLIDLCFICIATCCIMVLLFMVGELSLSDKEAHNFFYNPHLFYHILREISQFFGQNDYSLRAPLLFLHFCNLGLLYGICRHTLKNKYDCLFAILLYILIPGVNFSALFLIESGWIIFITFLVSYLATRYQQIPLILLFILTLFGSGMMIITLGIAFFMLRNKKYKTALFCFLCTLLNFYLYDLNIGGIPQGYILDTIGQIAMLYSPFLFIYYVYTIYWGIIHKNSILAYIAGSSIIFCILLSLRQNIDFYLLVPQSLVGIPILIQCFLNDLRMHLPEFRTKHYLFLGIIVTTLCCESILFFGNKVTYIFSKKPNFAQNYYFTKEIAHQIKSYGIDSINAPKTLQLPLQFYGISKGEDFTLIPTKNHKADIQILYNNVVIKKFNIKKN